ncbi:MAG TPA: hypothetical protein VF518_01315 [Polyangia bacterium]
MSTSGTTVKGGFYFNPRGLEILSVNGKTGLLTGKPGANYFRIPALAVLLLAPVLGGLFVMFLPVIGFVLVGQHFARLTAMSVRRMGGALAGNVAPAWRPGESYLAGKPEEGAAKDETGDTTKK